MKLEVVASPKLLLPVHLENRTVVVLDVLRATTTMIAALAAGVKQIRVFGDVEECRAAGTACSDPRIICGERHAQPPPGFDLGNSPGDFTAERCRGRAMFMTTTNGTAAILAARSAPELLIGAVVNRSAVAKLACTLGRDVTLLCAGQRMDIAMEDLLGCGAVLDVLAVATSDYINDAAHMSLHLYRHYRDKLGEVFRSCRGARTELLLGLEADIDYCAAPDRFPIVPRYDAGSDAIKLVN